ncbi:hypothetical protein ZHAS_00011245 [Anopheles sinensis]|uniref:Uncharacterized protein n=1 Tax=Anopheles sinensis TaxID=74873 RepID=A0A084VZP5_ANOSI|nr:hypothetical protein ZHAS_00011245 [Anopheles sinensis]
MPRSTITVSNLAKRTPDVAHLRDLPKGLLGDLPAKRNVMQRHPRGSACEHDRSIRRSHPIIAAGRIS